MLRVFPEKGGLMLAMQKSFWRCAWVLFISTVMGFQAPVHAGAVIPSFSPSNFVPGATIDNPYFPLPVGTTFRETASVTDPDNGETGFQIDENFVTSAVKSIAGVQARV